MRVQEFKGSVRLTCTREEFIQLRMAIAQRCSLLVNPFSSSEFDEDLKPVFERFKRVCDDLYMDMVQI